MEEARVVPAILLLALLPLGAGVPIAVEEIPGDLIASLRQLAPPATPP